MQSSQFHIILTDLFSYVRGKLHMVIPVKPITASAIDNPSLDGIIPSLQDAEKIFKHVLDTKKYNQEEVFSDYERLVRNQNELYALFDNHIVAGKKKDMDHDKVEKSLELENNIADIYGKYSEDIKQAGGTGGNKLRMYKICNEKAECILYGAINKDDEAGQIIASKMEGSGVELKNHLNGDAPENLVHTRHNLVMNTEDEKGKKDRHVEKRPFTKPKFAKDYEKLLEEQKNNSLVFVEATLVDTFGPKNFRKYIDGLVENNVMIAYAAPTDNAHMKEGKRGAQLYAAKHAHIVSLNAEEAIKFAHKDHDKFKDHEVKNNDDEHFKNSRKLIQQWIQTIGKTGYDLKENDQDEKKSFAKKILEDKKINDKIVIVTNGTSGSFAITKDTIMHVPSVEIERFRSSIGAGDAFTGAAVAKLTESGKLNLGDVNIYNALKLGAVMSAAVVENYGAQLTDELAEKAMAKHENVRRLPAGCTVKTISEKEEYLGVVA